MAPSKRETRDSVRARLKALSCDSLKYKNGQLGNMLAHLFNTPPSRISSFIQKTNVLGVFTPLAREADWTLNWPPRGLKKELKLCFPAPINQNAMAFFESSLNSLVDGQAFGATLPIPPKDAPKRVPETLFIPGMAFTKSGTRLGRGKGFYDRYLARFEGLKIGLCFEEQILEDIPTEEHDIPMDCVLTDKGIYLGD